MRTKVTPWVSVLFPPRRDITPLIERSCRENRRPSYNVIEVHGTDRVRVMLKEPFKEPELVADMGAHHRACRWQADGELFAESKA